MNNQILDFSDAQNRIQDFYLEMFALANKEICIEEKLQIYSLIAGLLANNFSLTYSSKIMEEKLIDISNTLFPEHSDVKFLDNTVLHVMTECYHVGGHTRVVDNWIKASKKKSSVFLNNKESIVPDFLNETVKKNGGVVIYNEGNTLVAKANHLFHEAIKYKYIVLHIHPYDILPLIAFGNKYFSRPVFLYNHANHLWGCCYSVADLVLELFESGKEFSVKYRGIPESKVDVVGIPVNMIQSSSLVDDKHKIVMTMASSYKLKTIEDYDFKSFVCMVLDENPDVIYEIIGVTLEDQEWVSLKNKYNNRLVLHGVMNKDDVLNCLSKVYVYVDSFPANSYTSVLEAINCKVPVLILKTKVLGYEFLTPVNNIENLVVETNKILRLNIEERNLIAQRNFEILNANYLPKAFSKKIEQLDKIGKHNPIKLRDISIYDDQYIKDYALFFAKILEHNELKILNSIYNYLTDKNVVQFFNLLIRYNYLLSSRFVENNQPIFEYVLGCGRYQQLFIGDKQKKFFEKKSLRKVYDVNTHNYTFNVKLFSEICYIRFDPLDVPVKIRLISAKIFCSNSCADLNVSEHNGILKNDGEYVFLHYDPQLIFEVPTQFVDDIEKVEFICVITTIRDFRNILSRKEQEYEQKLWDYKQQLQEYTYKL